MEALNIRIPSSNHYCVPPASKPVVPYNVKMPLYVKRQLNVKNNSKCEKRLSKCIQHLIRLYCDAICENLILMLA